MAVASSVSAGITGINEFYVSLASFLHPQKPLVLTQTMLRLNQKTDLDFCYGILLTTHNFFLKKCFIILTFTISTPGFVP